MRYLILALLCIFGCEKPCLKGHYINKVIPASESIYFMPCGDNCTMFVPLHEKEYIKKIFICDEYEIK